MTTNKLTDIKQFTKKPVTISAIQWTGDNLPAVIEFTGKHPRWSDWFADMDEYVAHVRGDSNRFKIFTLEGVMDALPGDWIIRGIHGEHYPCKPDIFSATYEPAELQEHRTAVEDKDLLGVIDALEHPAGINAAGKQVVRRALAELQERREADSQAQATLNRLAVILHGSEVDLNLLTVTAQSLMDRCKAGNSPVIGIDLASEPDRSVEVRYLAPPGYVMVPKELTCEMDDAAWDAYHETRSMSDIWAALLAAAPQQE